LNKNTYDELVNLSDEIGVMLWATIHGIKTKK
jgi:hypothetical protein